MCYGYLLKFVKKAGFDLENIWSAGFGLLKFKSAGFGCRKMHFGMQALAIFFGSLQALDFTNQRKKVVCRLRHPLVYPHGFHADFSLIGCPFCLDGPYDLPYEIWSL